MAPFATKEGASRASQIPIWLDVDVGHDDCFAILLAALHPNVRLLGISTIFGNAPLSHTTRNTLAILKAIGREDVPVYPGASKPFCRPIATAPDIHGESGLDGTTCLPVPDVQARNDMTAVEAMAKALSKEKAGTTWLVPTGALTNAALLFSVYTELQEHVAGISLMGGAIGSGFSNAPMGVVGGQGERFGNWTPFAEFNVYIDPESAQVIFGNPILAGKTTIAPLDLTHQFLATKKIQQRLLLGQQDVKDGAQPSTVRKLFVEILTFFAQTYADVFGLVAGPPLHDPLAVAAAFAPALFHDGGGERYHIDVVTDGDHGSSDHVREGGSQCGRTLAKLLEKGEKGVRIPRGLEAEKIWTIIDECLGSAEKLSGFDK